MKTIKKTLIIVDVQNDFCDGGALPANETESLTTQLNPLILSASKAGIPIVFTRDFHPRNHVSFHAQGGPWPPHCVQHSWGSRFVDGMIIPKSAVIINKGTDGSSMGYSPFENTKLLSLLRKLNITNLGVCGIATEYCVKNTVLDGIQLGFTVTLLTDLIRSVDASSGNGKRAVEEMIALGAIAASGLIWLG